MSNYSAAVQNGRLQVFSDLLASKTLASSTGSALAGYLVIGDNTLSGSTGILATITLSATPGTISGGVWTLSGTPLSATAGADGTAAKAELRNNAGTVIRSNLTVGLTLSDINLNSVTVKNGGTVTVTSGTITHG